MSIQNVVTHRIGASPGSVTSFFRRIRHHGAVLAVAALALGGSTAAGFTPYVIRTDILNNPPVIQPNNAYPGYAATELIIAAGGQKAALGSSAIDGTRLGDLGRVAIVRLDDRTRFAPGSGPYTAPYLNFWITDGNGNFAVVANEPSDPAFQPLYANGYSLTWADLANKVAKVYENSNLSWLPTSGSSGLPAQPGRQNPLSANLYTFADLAGYTILSPTPAQLAAPWPGLGGGAPRELVTNAAWGVNWVFGDTLANYVSGAEGYVVANAAVTADYVTPDVIYGSGNANGGWSIARANGIELGLRTKQRMPSPANVFNGNGAGVYSWPTYANLCGGRVNWNYDFSINADWLGTSGMMLDDFDFWLAVDLDPGEGVTASPYAAFNPFAKYTVATLDAGIGWDDNSLGTNATANSAGQEFNSIDPGTRTAADFANQAAQLGNFNLAQNSQNLGFLGADGSLDGLYSFRLWATPKGSGPNGTKLAETWMEVVVGNGPQSNDITSIDISPVAVGGPVVFNATSEINGSLFEYSLDGGQTWSTVAPTTAGIYPVCVRAYVTVPNLCTSLPPRRISGQKTCQVLLVVFDPSAGFVTGGGWISSPAGAYSADPTAIGRANFGFVSKYKKGANVPDGSTEFVFNAGGLNFHSSAYEWLVVNQNGTNAQFKGTGRINGAGNYGFMIKANDNGNGGATDTFRIHIWNIDAGDATVYDNGSDQTLGGGNIMIQTKK